MKLESFFSANENGVIPQMNMSGASFQTELKVKNEIFQETKKTFHAFSFGNTRSLMIITANGTYYWDKHVGLESLTFMVGEIFYGQVVNLLPLAQFGKTIDDFFAFLFD